MVAREEEEKVGSKDVKKMAIRRWCAKSAGWTAGAGGSNESCADLMSAIKDETPRAHDTCSAFLPWPCGVRRSDDASEAS